MVRAELAFDRWLSGGLSQRLAERIGAENRGMAVTTRHLKILAVSLVAGGTLSACGSVSSTAASSGSNCSSIPTITAHGQGVVSGTPDMAIVDLGVQTQDSTATNALKQNSSDANSLIKALFAKGVAAKDVQTSGLSLHAIYGGSTPVPTGYQVTNTVTVKVHSIDSTGTILDAAAKAAGNAIRIDQISFSVQDPTALFSQARATAVDQAATEAQAMAKAAGKHLGGLCSLNDAAPSLIPMNVSSFNSAVGTPSRIPIQPGSQQVKATVTAVYRLEP